MSMRRGSGASPPWRQTSMSAESPAIASSQASANGASTITRRAAATLKLCASASPPRATLTRATTAPICVRPSHSAKYSGRLAIIRPIVSPLATPALKAQREYWFMRCGEGAKIEVFALAQAAPAARRNGAPIRRRRAAGCAAGSRVALGGRLQRAQPGAGGRRALRPRRRAGGAAFIPASRNGCANGRARGRRRRAARRRRRR